VTGRVEAEIEKPFPDALALETVSGMLPEDFKVKVCVAAVFTFTLSNVRLLALQLMVETEGINLTV